MSTISPPLVKTEASGEPRQECPPSPPGHLPDFTPLSHPVNGQASFGCKMRRLTSGPTEFPPSTLSAPASSSTSARTSPTSAQNVPLLNHMLLDPHQFALLQQASLHNAAPATLPTGSGSLSPKETLEAWRHLSPTAAAAYAQMYSGAAYPGYDPSNGPALSGYPFSGLASMDLNGPRKRNATRETTSTLKAWLNEHRKNPYPTKGEKIMLAIITQMTLTQVSTWFANARRRLKKENKMTWSPRTRGEDDDDDDLDDKDDKGYLSNSQQANQSIASMLSVGEMIRRKRQIVQLLSSGLPPPPALISAGPMAANAVTPENMAHIDSLLRFRTALRDARRPDEEVSVDDEGAGDDDEEDIRNSREPSRTSVTPSPGARPKIWSIVDTATTEAVAARSLPDSLSHPPPVTPEQLLMASRFYGHPEAAAIEKQWYQALAQSRLGRRSPPRNASSPSP